MTDPTGPRYDAEIRDRARAAYERTGSVQGAAKEIGRSVARTHAYLSDLGILGRPDSRSSAQQRRRRKEANG